MIPVRRRGDIPYRTHASRAWRAYAGFLRPHRIAIGVSVLLALVPSAVAAGAALIVRRAFDTAFPSKDVRLIVQLALAAVALQLFGSGIQLAARWMALRTTRRVVSDVRKRLFDVLLSLSRSAHDKTTNSKLRELVVDDAERIDLMSMTIVTMLLPALVSVVVLTLVLLWLAPMLFALLAVSTAVTLYFARIITRKMRRAIDVHADLFSEYSSQLHSNARLLDLLRMRGAEDVTRARHSAQIEALRHTGMRMAWMQGIYPVMHQTMLAIITSIIIMAGGLSVLRGGMTAGSLAAFVTALLLMRTQLGPISVTLALVMTGQRALERAMGFMLDAEREPYSGTRTIKFDGTITFEGVSFSYGAEPLLDDVSITIGPRSIVAVAGGNGSGKTTLLQLMFGSYAPQKGRLLASGVPYEELSVAELRKSIGFVTQEPLLTDATIRDNITFGVETASDAEIAEAVRLGCADDMIAGLRSGFDTEVGEDGGLLSGGQRQRIALARALLRRPALLLLDEPTNHLDRESVVSFLRNMRNAPWAHTTVVASHDEAVLAEADVVFSVVSGRVKLVRNRRVVEAAS